MMEFVAAFFLGLMSAPHCAAMCGGIATALMMGAHRSEATPRPGNVIARSQPAAAGSHPCGAPPSAAGFANAGGPPVWVSALWFGSGKMLGYMTLGILAGATGFLLGSTHGGMLTALRALASLLLIGLGLYTAGWWMGLRRLETIVYRFWQPVLRSLRQLDLGRTANQLIAGALWGLLPCGIVYSVLGMAMASGSMLSGMMIMLAFGLGTLPFVLGAGGLLKVSLPFLHQQWVRLAVGLVLMGSGIISLLMVTGLLHRAH